VTSCVGTAVGSGQLRSPTGHAHVVVIVVVVVVLVVVAVVEEEEEERRKLVNLPRSDVTRSLPAIRRWLL